MSGGALDYVYHRVEDALDTIESWTQEPRPVEYDGVDGGEVEQRCRQAASEPEARAAVRAVLPALRAAGRVLHDVEWWFSDDYGPERVVEACEELLRAVARARTGT